MNKKIIKLIERNSVQELQAYFADMPAGKPLDLHDELVLLEHFPETAVTTFINRFRFSEDAEKVFIQKAPGNLRRKYINHYGLYEKTQKFIIDSNLTDVAFEFIRMRRFANVNYMLDKADPQIIRSYIQLNPLDNDKQVLKLLHHENKSLFRGYVDKGHFISEQVQMTVIEEKNISAFTALMYKINRNFKKKAHTMTFAQMQERQVADIMLAENLQVMVLDDSDRMFIELLLKTSPLAPEAQKLMFERNFDAEWFRLHVEHLYGVGGYRFELEYEPKLLKLLASKDLDDCLTKFRQRDDVSFVQSASPNAVLKYIKDFWLTDDGQVALIARGNSDLIQKLISRYTPEHGLCWQAEVKLVEIASPETIKQYISFHSMCGEALSLLEKKSRETLDFYYTRHAY